MFRWNVFICRVYVHTAAPFDPSPKPRCFPDNALIAQNLHFSRHQSSHPSSNQPAHIHYIYPRLFRLLIHLGAIHSLFFSGPFYMVNLCRGFIENLFVLIANCARDLHCLLYLFSGNYELFCSDCLFFIFRNNFEIKSLDYIPISRRCVREHSCEPQRCFLFYIKRIILFLYIYFKWHLHIKLKHTRQHPDKR